MTTIFFYGHTPVKNGRHMFSQFGECKFTDLETNIHFSKTEKWMMYSKAKFFGDGETARKILAEESPYRIKALGRQVKNFDEKKWEAVRSQIVFQGNWLKFSQNEDLKKILLETGDAELVEAAANDRIWGIGYTAGEAVKVDRSKWGLNLLGKALMEVRGKLRSS